MGNKIIIVAPHPDDETLGCGGTLLRHKAEGSEIHWLIVTAMKPEQGFAEERIARRAWEISVVAQHYGFTSVQSLNLPATRLDVLPMSELIAAIAKIFQNIMPEIVYLPFKGDVHSDHAVVSNAVLSCTKWFRHPSIKRILAYETLSETEFGISPDIEGFRPNVFVDIHPHLDKKIEILKTFSGELGEFPFPRSTGAVRALAQLRGISAGCSAAEAFMLLREIV